MGLAAGSTAAQLARDETRALVTAVFRKNAPPDMPSPQMALPGPSVAPSITTAPYALPTASVSTSRRERDHLLFTDANRTTSVAVGAGVSPQQVSPACTDCNFHACSQCKVTEGRNWAKCSFSPLEIPALKLPRRTPANAVALQLLLYGCRIRICEMKQKKQPKQQQKQHHRHLQKQQHKRKQHPTS